MLIGLPNAIIAGPQGGALNLWSQPRQHCQCGTWNNQTECLAGNARTRPAMSSLFSSREKWPASSRWIAACRRSALERLRTGATNEGSFHPPDHQNRGLVLSNHACCVVG